MTQVETSDIYYIELDAEADTYTGCVMILKKMVKLNNQMTYYLLVQI